MDEVQQLLQVCDVQRVGWWLILKGVCYLVRIWLRSDGIREIKILKDI